MADGSHATKINHFYNGSQVELARVEPAKRPGVGGDYQVTVGLVRAVHHDPDVAGAFCVLGGETCTPS